MLQRFLDYVGSDGSTFLERQFKLLLILLGIAVFTYGFGIGSVVLATVYWFLIVHWYLPLLWVLGSILYARISILKESRDSINSTEGDHQ